MAQLSLYIDDETMNSMRKKAAISSLSLSKYVASLVRSDVGNGWPEGYWGLFGSIQDKTFDEPAELSFDLDGKRGSF